MSETEGEWDKYDFWRWIIEKVLHKKWLRNPSYAMHYWRTLNDKEKEKLKEQNLTAVERRIKKLKRKGLLY